MSDDFPQPDLMDTSGRLRRLVFALIVGSAAAALAYVVTNSMAHPDAARTTGAYKFVFYMTALAGAIAFSIALVIQNKIADKRYRENLVAKAEVRKMSS
jgi:hypothetical protein